MKFKRIYDKKTIESYIGEIGGREGVKLEDQYLVTTKGLKLLTKHPLNQV